MPYSYEEAKRKIPHVLKAIALQAVDTVIVLDTVSVTSRDVEDRIMAMQGYMSYLWRLFMAACKTPKEARKRIEEAARE